MPQADFAFTPALEVVGEQTSISLFADSPQTLEILREDAEMAGLHIRPSHHLKSLVQGEVPALGDIVVVDCPDISGSGLAALSRIDMQMARTGAHLIVSTSTGALDDVFGCIDQSGAQILVDPSRADRVLALGRAVAGNTGSRLRDLTGEDRLTLLKLTEQVGEIAKRLDRMGQQGMTADGGVFRFESPGPEYRGGDNDDGTRKLIGEGRPSLPDPRLVRRMIQQRQLRARFFDSELFADPAWDMLLDLTAARAEHQRVSVTSLCIASGVPTTTALRWIGQMIEAGLFERVEDEADKRRAFIALSDKTAEAMARYFAELG